jgi:acyl-coenzyme A synthetase/AMP-(fatty) acid ligase
VLAAAGAIGWVIDSSALPALATHEPAEQARLQPVYVVAHDVQEPPNGLPALYPQRTTASGATERSGKTCSQDAACVLFTSGSTGRPKGVLIDGAMLLSCANTERQCFEITSSDRLLCVLPLSFDVALFQPFAAMTAGAELHISSKWHVKDLATVIQRAKITAMNALPGVWSTALWHRGGAFMLFGAPTPSLRYVTVSGGTLPTTTFRCLAEALGPSTSIHRTYGQTETS